MDPDRSRQALSHTSWAKDRAQSYDRLAFLGDSVLNLAVSNELHTRLPRSTAGRLTKTRAQVVSRRSCVEVARATHVPERMLATAPPGHEHQVKRLAGADSVLAEAVEALIGASFEQYGFTVTSDAVAEAFEPQIQHALANMFDFKSELQERLARRGELVTYEVVKEEGPPHDRLFETVAAVAGAAVGSGRGRSKKESEQRAARVALDRLDREEASAT